MAFIFNDEYEEVSAPKEGGFKKLEKGYHVFKILEASEKEFDSGSECVSLSVEVEGSRYFIDLFHKNKGGVENAFNTKLLHDISIVADVKSLVKEFGIEKAFKGIEFGGLVDVEKDDYNGVVKERIKLLQVLNPTTLKNSWGKEDKFWFEKLGVEYPTTPAVAETAAKSKKKKASKVVEDEIDDDDLPF